MQPLNPIIPIESPTTYSKKNKLQKTSGWLTILALLIAVLALLDTGLFQRHIQHKILLLKQQLSTLQAQTQSSEQVIATLKTPFETLFFSQLGQITILVQLAESNFLYLGDSNSCILQLDRASKLIKPLIISTDPKIRNNYLPSLNKIQLQLQTLTNTLQSSNTNDRQMILMELTTLQKQVTQLPLFILPVKDLKIGALANSQGTLTWRERLRQNLQYLKGLIVIRHQNQPLSPLLPPEQQIYLEQNIQLLLQQAQWAVLRSHTDIYVASLQQAQQLVTHYFSENSKATQQFSGILTQLINKSLPTVHLDFSSLLNSLNSLIALQNTQFVNSGNNNTSVQSTISAVGKLEKPT